MRIFDTCNFKSQREYLHGRTFVYLLIDILRLEFMCYTCRALHRICPCGVLAWGTRNFGALYSGGVCLGVFLSAGVSSKYIKSGKSAKMGNEYKELYEISRFRQLYFVGKYISVTAR